jgi:hypothetical protein
LEYVRYQGRWQLYSHAFAERGYGYAALDRPDFHDLTSGLLIHHYGAFWVLIITF